MSIYIYIIKCIFNDASHPVVHCKSQGDPYFLLTKKTTNVNDILLQKYMCFVLLNIIVTVSIQNPYSILQ